MVESRPFVTTTEKRSSGLQLGRRRRLGLVGATLALSVAACGGSHSGKSTENSTAAATASAQAGAAVATPPQTRDPHADICKTSPNPHSGTYQECIFPGGGIKEHGLPVFDYTNGSNKKGSKGPVAIPYSETRPIYVKCRITDKQLGDAAMESDNGGGEYVLAGVAPYAGRVAIADNFWNPTVAPNELPYDPKVQICTAADVAQVTDPLHS